MCVHASVYVVPRFRFLYGRRTGGCVGVSWKKICALAGVLCVYPAEAFYPRGGGRKKEAMSGETVTSGVFYWQMKI